MKRLGKEKADKLNSEHPGMTLSSWLDLNYTHVTLDQHITQDGKRLVCKPFCVELTMALLSTDNVADWAKVALHFAPAGTIIDKVPIDYYEQKVLLVRQLLTKKLVTDPDNKMAQRFLNILERRDADRWAAKKQALSVRATATDPNSSKGGGDGQEKKITFDFEIVRA
jgi:hypothetical protein